MRKSTIKKSLLLLAAGSSLLFANCVTRSFHNAKLSEVKTELTEKHQKAMATKTQQMEAQAMALMRKNKAHKALLARFKTDCRQQLDTLSNKNSAKAQRLRRAMSYINRLEAKINSWKDLHKRLTKIFKVKIAEGSLSVKIERGLIILRMPEKVLFKLGSAKLVAMGQGMIGEVAKVLSREPYRWQVAGHADSTGKADFNWNLSHRRAMAVMKVMLKSDMAPTKISAASYGQYQPRASNDTPEGRAQNRRTEIIFMPKIKALLLADTKKKLSHICRPKTNKAS